jgi:hypothetical protein
MKPSRVVVKPIAAVRKALPEREQFILNIKNEMLVVSRSRHAREARVVGQ